MTSAARRDAYRALFDQGLDSDTIATLRDATQRGWVPGSERFRERIGRVTGGRAVEAPRRGRPPKHASDEPLVISHGPRLL